MGRPSVPICSKPSGARHHTTSPARRREASGVWGRCGRFVWGGYVSASVLSIASKSSAASQPLRHPHPSQSNANCDPQTRHRAPRPSPREFERFAQELQNGSALIVTRAPHALLHVLLPSAPIAFHVHDLHMRTPQCSVAPSRLSLSTPPPSVFRSRRPPHCRRAVLKRSSSILR